jgi:hypothetical protein
MEKELLRLVSLTDNNWLPALINGTPIESTYKLAFDIIRDTKSSYIKSFKIAFRPILEK